MQVILVRSERRKKHTSFNDFCVVAQQQQGYPRNYCFVRALGFSDISLVKLSKDTLVRRRNVGHFICFAHLLFFLAQGVFLLFLSVFTHNVYSSGYREMVLLFILHLTHEFRLKPHKVSSFLISYFRF